MLGIKIDLFSGKEKAPECKLDQEKGLIVGKIEQKALVAPCYYHLLPMIFEGKSSHFVFRGGRGSGKSSFCAIHVVSHILTHPKDDAIVLLKIADGIRSSVSQNIAWAIGLFGLDDFFKINRTTQTYTYLPTGQQILLKGCDDPVKLKSIKSVSGRFGVLWFEELEQFSGADEVRSVLFTFMRGVGESSRQLVLYSYNPPKKRHHWLNSEFMLAKNQVITHTTYLDVPSEWLGDTFLALAEELKEKNEKGYRWELLGEVIGQGLEVFENIIETTINEAMLDAMPSTYKGVDFGWADPTVAIEVYYDRQNRSIYIVRELYKTRLSVESLSEWLINNGMHKGGYLICDSADPSKIDGLRRSGVINAMGAKKGKDSIRNGLNWLSLYIQNIYIDKDRTPNAYREFTQYTYEQNKDGVISDTPPDKNNHTIDALRYALEPVVIRQGGA